MKKLNLIRTTILASSLLLQLNTLCFHSRGAAGDVDLSFDPGSGVNGTVYAVAVQSDGKVIIAGTFNMVKGLQRLGIARLNVDGSGDSSFNPGTILGYSGIVFCVTLQPDGKVLVGGNFWTVNGAALNNLARLNADGSLDNTFDPGSGANNVVYSIIPQSDGKLLIGGYFFEINGTSRNGIARLNANGSLDGSFNPGTGADGGGVYAVALQSDGKVLIGGNFATVNGTGRQGIALLNANGSLNAGFNPGTGASGGDVGAVAQQADGKVLIGGTFTAFNGTNRSGLARLNANGSLDNAFNPGIGAAPIVGLILPQADGKILIEGRFSTVNGTSRNRIARLNANGSLDESFNSNPGVDDIIHSLVVRTDGKMMIAGVFITVDGVRRNRVARLNADGTLDSSFDPGRGLEGAASWSVSSLKVQPDGKVLIGGSFYSLNGTNPNGRARLNADGSLDGTFIPGSFHPDIGEISSDSDNNVVTAAAGQSDGKVLIGGYSVHWDCDPESCNVWAIYFLDRVNADGSRDPGFFYPSSVNYESDWDNYAIKSIVVQSDGKVLIGRSPTVNGTNYAGVVRLNSNGSLDGTGVTPGFYSMVGSAVVQSDGKLLIGGAFTNVNGASRNGIARLNADESLDGSFNPGTGVSGGSVLSIALQPDGKVLIGGSFTTVNGTNRNRIARLNANGSLDSSFNPGTGANQTVLSIALQPDGKVLIGGVFFTVNGVVRPFVARLYGDSFAPPSLNIARSNSFVIVSWSVTVPNFQLQESTNLLSAAWSPVAQPTVTNAGQISVTVPTTVGRKFFQLKSQ